MKILDFVLPKLVPLNSRLLPRLLLAIWCLVTLVHVSHCFTSLCLRKRTANPYLRTQIGVTAWQSDDKDDYCFDKAFRTGSLLLESLEMGQVPKEIAMSGISLAPLSSQVAEVLKGIQQANDLSSSSEMKTDTSSEYNLPPSLSSYSSSSDSSYWVRIMPLLQELFAESFQAVVDSHRFLCDSRNSSASSSTIRLSPYDLFHGHLFRRSFTRSTTANATISHTVNPIYPQTRHQLGILFHCFEYPAVNNTWGILENITLGYGQAESTCHPTLEEWRFRNVLWLLGWDDDNDNGTIHPHIWLLNGSAPEISQLQMDDTAFGPQSPNAVWEGFLVGTEDCFGQVLTDLYHCTEDGSIWCEITR